MLVFVILAEIGFIIFFQLWLKLTLALAMIERDGDGGWVEGVPSLSHSFLFCVLFFKVVSTGSIVRAAERSF